MIKFGNPTDEQVKAMKDDIASQANENVPEGARVLWPDDDERISQEYLEQDSKKND